METQNSFQRHDPITQRMPRTLRESESDVMDWWRSAEAEVANEAHIRQMFAEPARPRRLSRSHFWAEIALYVIAAGVFWAFVKGWL